MRTYSVQKLEEIEVKPEKVGALSRMVLTINAAPNILTASQVEEEHTKNPSNVITGLGYGGYAILKGVFNGVTGIVTEPVKGGSKDGISGFAKGIGRGLIGVVAKPIGGVAGFF